MAGAGKTGPGVAPAQGERAAVVGYTNQYDLAARVVVAQLSLLELIRVADPSAGAADDFQFKAGPHRHAVQVKWAQYPSAFQWGEFVNSTASRQALIRQMADAWTRIRSEWDGPLQVHLCTNEFPSATTPQAGSALASVAAGQPRHFAAFLARSFLPVQKSLQDGTSWPVLRATPLVADWAAAWDDIVAACALDDEKFAAFLGDFSLEFVGHPELRLARMADDRTSDIAAVAAQLQKLVADPLQPIEISKEELLGHLGWIERIRYRNPHRFPVPQSYAANEAARASIEQRVASLKCGYVALIGPAGSGKSTLLETLELPGRIARYYAFVPDSPDPLSGRGEAESFFHDVSLALEDAGLHRVGYGSGIAAQRAIFFDQLTRAGERFAAEGGRTFIVVDGLDHIPREQNPTRSLLDELPPAAAIPDGVHIILGTQTAQILPAAVRESLANDGRTVDLPPLQADEVRRVIEQSQVGSVALTVSGGRHGD